MVSPFSERAATPLSLCFIVQKMAASRRWPSGWKTSYPLLSSPGSPLQWGKYLFLSIDSIVGNISRTAHETISTANGLYVCGNRRTSERVNSTVMMTMMMIEIFFFKVKVAIKEEHFRILAGAGEFVRIRKSRLHCWFFPGREAWARLWNNSRVMMMILWLTLWIIETS